MPQRSCMGAAGSPGRVCGTLRHTSVPSATANAARLSPARQRLAAFHWSRTPAQSAGRAWGFQDSVVWFSGRFTCWVKNTMPHT